MHWQRSLQLHTAKKTALQVVIYEKWMIFLILRWDAFEFYKGKSLWAVVHLYGSLSYLIGNFVSMR